jgi:hypothetical protein
MRELTRARIWTALSLAVIADAVQLGMLPFFAEGFLSPANDGLDLVVAVAMFLLLGWHWALLPSVMAEMVPAVNLFPTWTAAVIFVARRGPGGAPAALLAGELDQGKPGALPAAGANETPAGGGDRPTA